VVRRRVRLRGSKIAGLLFLVLRVATLTVAQSRDQPPTFTSSTQLVLVPTVVKDKSGAHIPGLTKASFILKQDGKPRPITVFEEVRASSSRLHRSKGENGSFSNFDSEDNNHHRLNIFVLDLVNTPLQDQSHLREALLQFLLETADSGDPICLLVLTGSGLTMVHDFTDDPKVLGEAVRKVKSSAPMVHTQTVDAAHPSPSDTLGALLTKLIRGQLEGEAGLASLENKNRALITVQGLQQIAKAFRGFPERKALIWASSGFPFSLSSPAYLMCEPACPTHQRGEVQSAYDDVWRMMNDAQIAVYTVDLRLSVASASAEQATFTRPYDVGDPQFDTAAQAKWQQGDTTSTLQYFAENTGGRAFLGGSNLVQSFRQAIQDNSDYYMLGFYVGKSDTKPGWHPISVKVEEKGAHVRFRRGFFFSADTSAPSARQDIALALSSPLDFTGLPLSVTWSGEKPGKQAGHIRTQFDLVLPANVASVDESESNHMVLDIAVVAKDSSGNVAADLSQRIDNHLKAESLEQIRIHGMTYRNGLELSPGSYVVRFVVRDALGNRMGSVVADLKLGP
jgi:VWFA-related protein